MTNLSDDVQVEKRISAKGREYTITRRAKPSSVAPIITASSDAKEDFGLQITWDRQSTDDWNITAQGVEDIASISSYYVKEDSTDSEGNISCTINFQNTKHYYYTFYDETGDYYTCDTWEDSTHYINYYSTKPNIRFVTGS